MYGGMQAKVGWLQLKRSFHALKLSPLALLNSWKILKRKKCPSLSDWTYFRNCPCFPVLESKLEVISDETDKVKAAVFVT
jgi:hypothetical protein